MKKLIGSFGAAALAVLALSATVAAAGPHGAGTGTVQGQASPQAQSQGATQSQGAGRGPAQGAQAAGGDVVASILGLTNAQVQDLRQSGLSLAQIAAKQGVDPQKLVDALVAQWSTRIDYRVSTGALTTAEAATLKSQLAVRAKDMVDQTALGGMRGAAVGAGPSQGRGAGQGRAAAGSGPGTAAAAGTCDGTGSMGHGHAGTTQP